MDTRQTSAIEAMAEWCHAAAPFSALARERAVHAIVDTFACMVAGRGDASVQAVCSAFTGPGATDGPCRVITGSRSSPGTAALINGTAAHALDYDDNFRPGMSHASAVLVPALLAVADLTKATGRAFTEAYLTGLQAQAFVGSGVGEEHYTAGWHGTSTIGCIGTAAGTAKLLGLDAPAIARALTIAVSMASGTKGQFGTPIKPFHAGMAARNAVEAAFLAQAGMRGRMDILECAQGFHELFSGDAGQRWDPEAIWETGTHVIETDGVMPKRHPCCGSTHLIVDALLDLTREDGFDQDEVASIETLVGIANHRNLAYPKPRDEMEARFSMQYCVARALRKGCLELTDFTPEAIEHHSGDPLLECISMRHRSEQEERAAVDRLPHLLTVRLIDGRTLERSRSFAKGALNEPFSEEDRLRKFLDCCKELDRPASVYATLARLSDAETLDCLGFMFQTGRCAGDTARLAV